MRSRKRHWASLKKEQDVALEELESRQKPGTTEAEQKKALDRFYETAADLGRRAVAIVKNRPDAPDAIETLNWARSAGTEGNAELAGVVYDMVAEHYLDSDAILPLCRIAWVDAVKSPQVETCLRAAVERSKNPRVRSLCCFSLGRCYLELASTARDLNDPVRGEYPRRILDRYGPALIQRLRSVDPEKLDLARPRSVSIARSKSSVISDPWASTSPPMGEQAAGDAFSDASPWHRSHRA